jgi:hypothetical protein
MTEEPWVGARRHCIFGLRTRSSFVV